MRLVHLIPNMRRAGAESVVANLCGGLADVEHEVHLVIIGNRFEYESDLCDSNVKIHLLNLTHGPVRFYQRIKRHQIQRCLLKVLKKINPEILHAHLSHSLIWGGVAIKKLGITTFYTNHGLGPVLHPPTLTDRWRRWEFVRSVKKTRCLLMSTSALGARLLEEGLGLISGSITVQPNPIDLKRYHPPSRVFDDMPPVVLMIGTLYPLKRVHIGIQAIKALDGMPEMILKIVGEGPERSNLEDLAGSLCHQTKIQFLGVRHDIADLLQAGGILWLLSEREGMPMAALEAMASGVPVIATDVPGTNELIQDGTNGLLVPLDNPRAVAEATCRLWREPLLRYQLIEGGIRTVQRFSLENVIKQHLEHYQKALNELSYTRT